MITQRLRMLFLTADEFPPYRPDVETLFGKELLGRGHRIDWIMRNAQAGAPSGRIEWCGSQAWIAPAIPGRRTIDRVRKHLVTLRNDLRVFGLARSGRYDCIQVKDKFVGGLIGLLAARLAGLPFYFWLSFPYPEASLVQARTPGVPYRLLKRLRGWLFHWTLYRVIARRADHLFVQSEEMKRRMALEGVPEEKMTPVPMGVDGALCARAETPAPGVPGLIVYLGALDRMRRLHFLIRSFALVAARHPQAQLRLVGDAYETADRRSLEHEVRRLRLVDRVTFTGFLPRAEAMAHVEAACVCVSPIPPDPIYDVASPTKVLEYLAVAKPVVATAQPDQRQVLEQSGGGLCTPYDEGEFARALEWMLEHPEDARRMGERGRVYVSAVRSYATIAERLEGVYARLAEERARRARLRKPLSPLARTSRSPRPPTRLP